jgi:hypothetical protein
MNKGFEKLIAELNKDFGIVTYLKLRADYPDQDPAFYNIVEGRNERHFSKLKQGLIELNNLNFKNINIDNYFKMLDGDVKAIDKLCLDCLKAILNRNISVAENSQSVSLGLAISDQMINFLISAIVESCSIYKIEPTNSFQVLLKEQLGFYQNKIITNIPLENRKNLTAYCFALFPDESIRTIAKKVGKDPKTLSVWCTEPEFKAVIEMFKEVIQESANK